MRRGEVASPRGASGARCCGAPTAWILLTPYWSARPGCPQPVAGETPVILRCMSATSAEWLEGQTDRILSRQRAQAETAKLLATFATAVAAGLVATALQVAPSTTADRRALVLLFASFLLALFVVFADRLAEADHNHVLTAAKLSGSDEATTLAELRTANLTAVNYNEGVISIMRVALIVQLLLSVLAAAAAAAPLVL